MTLPFQIRWWFRTVWSFITSYGQVVPKNGPRILKFLENSNWERKWLHLLGLKETDSMMTKNFVWSLKTMDKGWPKKAGKTVTCSIRETQLRPFFSACLINLGRLFISSSSESHLQKIPTNTSFVAMSTLVEFQSRKQSQVFAIRFITKTKGWKFVLSFYLGDNNFCYPLVYFWAI